MYNPLRPISYQQISTTAAHERPLDIKALFRVLYSNALTILGSAAVFGCLALLYILITPPTFLASAQLMISAQKVGASNDQPTAADEMIIESQMEIIKSGEVLRGVVTDLGLASNPEFTSGGFSISEVLHSLLAMLSSSKSSDGQAAVSEDAAENELVVELRRQLWVRRVGQSTVMEVSAGSTDPQMAAAIANSVAQHFISHDIATRSQSAQRSSDWLAERVAHLKADVLVADRAATQFQAAGDPGDKFKLAELKSAADTARRLYETYLLNLS
ncbi:Wzz/FepE/Etk N-terminal domain-containing protein, partial [Rhizobium sp. RAF56]|uniref:Wzz/FepE/Etk N-terminal domain-containing protein n=1 Tax=Rhizobium sp. RAF56 TaxID=3233062 RepID=UPI003F9D6A4C